mgnify:CR=1 FL=1|nr:MAG TPA: hypothetical protein [Caudoviricetes sp.]
MQKNLDYYIENIEYIYLTIETISAKYRQNLINNILNESYKNLDLTPESIKASLYIILYQCKHDNDFSINHLLDLLNTEFLKTNITFIYEPSLNMKLKYARSGIIKAETDNVIYIYVNTEFFEILQNANLITRHNISMNNLVEDLMKLYSHEYTHLDQFNLQKEIQPGIDSTKITTPEEVKKYLSNQREIDAHAREVANSLLLIGKTPKEIENLFTTKNGSQTLISLSTIYGLYYDYFGRALWKKTKDWTETDKADMKIFNKFKKRICDFLLLDKKFINKDKLLYTIANKPA